MTAVVSVLVPLLIVLVIAVALHRRGHAPWQRRREPAASLGEGESRTAQRVVADWRRSTGGPHRPWREARIKSSALDRFTGYPWPERPPLRKERYSISHGRRVEFEGFTMLAFQCRYRETSSVTGPFYTVMVVSVDVPQWTSKVGVYRGSPPTLNNFRTGVEEFDRNFTVDTDDEAFARRVLGQDIPRWLATDPHYAALSFVLENGALSTWLRGDFDEQALDLMTEALVQFINRVPPER